MLITFKSKAAADVLMYKTHAKILLDLLHKNLERGVVTAAESAAAIASLEAEIAASKRNDANRQLAHDASTYDDAQDDDQEKKAVIEVSFATRAFPLLEMLRAAQKGGYDVLWGV